MTGASSMRRKEFETRFSISDSGCAFGLHVETHFCRQCFSEPRFDIRILYNNESPRLKIMRGWGVGRSGEDAFNNGIRYRVRFEASNGTT